jgi:steroid delta-isomerase-like uncharacterized protein
MSADVDALLDGWEAAWSGRDPGAFAAVCTPDVHYEDPACGDRPREAIDELAEHAARLWQAFPDVRVERSGERLSDGRFVAAPVKVVGHHRGELEGLPPTGRFVVVQAVCYCELDAQGERLFRVRTFFDAWNAAVQVRILPARGTLSERALLVLRGFGLRARS